MNGAYPWPMMVALLLRTAWPAALLLVIAACAAGPRSSSAPPSGTPPASVGSSHPSSPSTLPSSAASSGSPLAGDPLHAVSLVDVRTGEAFQLGTLAADQPLLLEPMAIWCSNCRGQQQQVVTAHELVGFHSVSLDIDPGEVAADLAAYADREGFDWRFAMADAALYTALRDRFGSSAIYPTAMPKILLRTDGSVELIGLGQQMGPNELAAAIRP
jgi:hypothetical protein